MLIVILEILILIVISSVTMYFALVLYMAQRGANYVPTPAKDIASALSVLKRGDVFVDLGFGRGEVLEAALAQGASKVIGYELDPYRFLKVWLKLRHYGRRVELHFADIWFADLSAADVIFTFFTVAHMPKLYDKVKKEAKTARWFVSYVHVIQGVQPTKSAGKVLFFRL